MSEKCARSSLVSHLSCAEAEQTTNADCTHLSHDGRSGGGDEDSDGDGDGNIRILETSHAARISGMGYRRGRHMDATQSERPELCGKKSGSKQTQKEDGNSDHVRAERVGVI